MKLLRVENLPKGLAPSTSDRNFGYWQKTLFGKFVAIHEQKPAIEAAEEAKKLVPASIANSTWFARVVLVAQAAELALPAGSYDEALAAFSKHQNASLQPGANQATGLAETKPITFLDINDIDPNKEHTITRKELEEKNPYAIAYIKALSKKHGNRQIAYKAIQHDETYGYRYDAIGLTGEVLFNPPKIGTIYSDGSRGFYSFTDKSDGLSGYKEITFYPGVLPLEIDETVTLRKGDLNNLEILKRLGFAYLSNEQRFYVEIRGQRGLLKLDEASIFNVRVRKDNRIYIEFFARHNGKTICLDDENEIKIRRIKYVPKYIPRRNRSTY